MTVMVLIAGVVLAWAVFLLVAYLRGRRVRTYRIETLRPVPPLPAVSLYGQPRSVEAGRRRRAARTRHVRGEAPWLR